MSSFNINENPVGLGAIPWLVQGLKTLWRRVTGIAESGGGGSANMKIGNTVEDSIPNTILYSNAGGKLSNDIRFFYNEVDGILSVRRTEDGTSLLKIDLGSGDCHIGDDNGDYGSANVIVTPGSGTIELNAPTVTVNGNPIPVANEGKLRIAAIGNTQFDLPADTWLLGFSVMTPDGGHNIISVGTVPAGIDMLHAYDFNDDTNNFESVNLIQAPFFWSENQPKTIYITNSSGTDVIYQILMR